MVIKAVDLNQDLRAQEMQGIRIPTLEYKVNLLAVSDGRCDVTVKISE